MKAFDRQEHEELVRAFFEQCKRDNPQHFQEVCKKHDVLSKWDIRRIKRSERQQGLIGLQPCSIDGTITDDYGYESLYDLEDNDGTH